MEFTLTNGIYFYNSLYPLTVEAITAAYGESGGDTQDLSDPLRKHLEIIVELINAAFYDGIKEGKRLQARKA